MAVCIENTRATVIQKPIDGECEWRVETDSRASTIDSDGKAPESSGVVKAKHVVLTTNGDVTGRLCPSLQRYII